MRTVFSLDLRSLALLRVLLGALIMVQVWTLFPDAEALLSDAGMFPRKALIEGAWSPWALSLYMLAETPFQARVLLLLQALAALGLAAGLRTRWCALASWILLVSLHNRNPLILNGGDTLMAVLSFWILFLPVHARFSLDRLFAPARGDRGSPPAAFCDLASAALVLQLCLVYWMTVLFKTDPSWWNGDAVRIALESDQFVKPAGLWLRGLTALHAPLTWATILWEMLGPLLLFAPFANAALRTVAVAGFTMFHLGLEATMELGLFPAACIAAWLGLLPGAFWNRVARLLPARRMAAAAATLRSLGLAPGPLPARPGLVARAVVVVAFLYILAWNVRSYAPDGIGGRLLPQEASAPGHFLKIRQKWDMFSPAPPRVDGWFVLRGVQFNGGEIDLLAGGAPLTWEKPALVVAQFPNRRWGKYFNNIRTARHRALRGPAVDYLVRKWNAGVDVGWQVREVELWYMLERTLDEGVAAPEPRRLWYRRNIRPTLR